MSTRKPAKKEKTGLKLVNLQIENYFDLLVEKTLTYTFKLPVA